MERHLGHGHTCAAAPRVPRQRASRTDISHSASFSIEGPLHGFTDAAGSRTCRRHRPSLAGASMGPQLLGHGHPLSQQCGAPAHRPSYRTAAPSLACGGPPGQRTRFSSFDGGALADRVRPRRRAAARAWLPQTPGEPPPRRPGCSRGRSDLPDIYAPGPSTVKKPGWPDPKEGAHALPATQPTLHGCRRPARARLEGLSAPDPLSPSPG